MQIQSFLLYFGYIRHATCNIEVVFGEYLDPVVGFAEWLPRDIIWKLNAPGILHKTLAKEVEHAIKYPRQEFSSRETPTRNLPAHLRKSTRSGR